MSMRVITVALLLAAFGYMAQAQKRNPSFELLAAARTHDQAAVTRLLDEGAGVNARNRLGDTPLNIAARDGELALVRLLIARGADVNLPNLARVTGAHRPAQLYRFVEEGRYEWGATAGDQP